MRNLFLILSTIFLIGCGETKYILMPQEGNAPTFETKDFKYKEVISIEAWPEEDENGTYIVTKEDDFTYFTEDYKNLRSNYNLLLRNIISFNGDVFKWNEEQNNKKPIEIDKAYIENF
jgi:hypothetical protein